MSTGTVGTASLTLSKEKESFLVFLTLTNNAGDELKHGEMVYADGDLTVDRIVDSTDDAEFPVGVVDVGGADGEHVTVATCFQRTLKVRNAEGGALAAGDLVRPSGVINANGLPEWELADADDLGPTTEAVGTWASGVVIQGGADEAQCLVGILRTPVRPAPVTA